MAKNQGQPPTSNQQGTEAINPTTYKKRGPANNIGAWAPILPQLSLQLRPQPWLTLCFVVSLETLPQKTQPSRVSIPHRN